MPKASPDDEFDRVPLGRDDCAVVQSERDLVSILEEFVVRHQGRADFLVGESSQELDGHRKSQRVLRSEVCVSLFHLGL